MPKNYHKTRETIGHRSRQFIIDVQRTFIDGGKGCVARETVMNRGHIIYPGYLQVSGNLAGGQLFATLEPSRSHVSRQDQLSFLRRLS